MGLTGGGGARCVHRVKGDGHTRAHARTFAVYTPSMFLCTRIEQDGCIQSVAKIFLFNLAREIFYGFSGMIIVFFPLSFPLC